MKKMIFTLFLAQVLISTPVLHAEEEGANGEPQITIRHDNEKTFYEYRINGVLTEIKVVPKVGPVYYLVPADGGGWIQEDKSQLLVPSWVIFRW
ncbi:MAG: DUF2782 domain-containing protein [Hahellaceae bacterium]|nr:DUF2782 domain-containing protein [Hahellaceae bacterium]MCP5168429.1 DUF2782 domain-containing protein [Hahellaceae bacterium]